MSKDLKEKAIIIKGKQYVLVSDRIIYFNETYTTGSINTRYQLHNDMFVVTAVVKPNADQTFTGHSQAIIGDGMVNKSAALENAETSAVGRALAMMGIGVIESIASADEVNKAVGSSGKRQESNLATDKQRKIISDKLFPIGYTTPDEIKNWLSTEYGINGLLTKTDATTVIDDLISNESEDEL